MTQTYENNKVISSEWKLSCQNPVLGETVWGGLTMEFLFVMRAPKAILTGRGRYCLSYFHGSHILDVGAWTASTATKSVHPIPVVIISFFQYLTTCIPPFIQKAKYKRNTGIFRKLQNASNFGQHGPLYRNWVSSVLSQVIIIFILKTI